MLVLDGNQRSALATVRALGKSGISVHVGEAAEDSLAGRSRYCAARFSHAPADSSAAAFIEDLSRYLTQHRIGICLPMTDISTHLLLANRDRLPALQMPCPDIADYEAASDKARLVELALEIGIAVPESILHVPRPGQLIPDTSMLPYPLVIKPVNSRIPVGDGYLKTTVITVQDEQAFRDAIDKFEWLRKHPYLIQEYIPGSGAGVFTIYRNGQPLVYFAHRRIREKPPSGGVSVLSESVPIDPQLRDIAKRLLGKLNWHGPAMVEFRVADDGTAYLMEINGRFWGSLALAVGCGLNFPLIAYELATGKEIEPQGSYRTGIRNRWLLGDLDNLYLTMRNRSADNSIRHRLRTLGTFLIPFPRRTQYEVLNFRDMAPFLYELRRYISRQ